MSHQLGRVIDEGVRWHVLVDNFGMTLLIDHEVFLVFFHPSVSSLARFLVFEALEEHRASHTCRASALRLRILAGGVRETLRYRHRHDLVLLAWLGGPLLRLVSILLQSAG